jgi:hypothetical protein
VPDESGHDASTTLVRQRDSARRSLLRANSAVAFVLLAVLTLAAVAVFTSGRARRLQRLAESARADARAELWRAYLSDIRALRQDNALGRRPAALDVIRRATAIAPSVELRNEAVATLALTDFPLDTALIPARPVMPSIELCAIARSSNPMAMWSSGE